jgi:hypothetical protein
MLYAPLNVFRGRSRSPTAVHLSPACHTRLYPVPECVISDDFVELRVVGKCVGTGADKRHAPFQHIDQLRQFIDAGCGEATYPNA